MNKSTISDAELVRALQDAGHPGGEIQRVLHERQAWIKFYREMRDDFAQAALQGLLANNPVGEAESFAAAAYRLADAILAERAKITKP